MYVENDTIDSSVAAKIEEVRAYYRREYNQWYLTVTYSYKDKDGSVKELEIPAIPLPLPQNHLPVVKDRNADCDILRPSIFWHEYMPFIFFAPDARLDMGNIHDQNGVPIRGSKAFYAIKDMPKSMTKAEIEEALGYKINIIEEDKND